jgi:hypothetical protein
LRLDLGEKTGKKDGEGSDYTGGTVIFMHKSRFIEVLDLW